MLQIIIKIIIKVYFFLIKKDRVAYARKLGVRWGERGKILEDPERVFGSEPWLVSLGDDVYITSGVRFLTHNGSMWCARNLDPSLERCDIFAPIKVGNNVSFGLNVIIMAGVQIGDNVIIGSNCVVTKNIPSNCVFAGVPGKQIGTMEEFIKKTKENSACP